MTVDRALLEAAEEAVRQGRADSVSGWVNVALAERAARELKLAAMAKAVAAYEARHGVITSAELAAQARADRADRVVVRKAPAVAASKRGRRAA